MSMPIYSFNMDASKIIQLLLQSYECVTHSVVPQEVVPQHVPAASHANRLIVIGAGKASAAMAAAFEVGYDDAIEGLVITRYGHSVPTQKITIREAAHPVPDEAGQHAVIEMLSLLESAGEDDTVVCLISGGGSALLSAPVDGVSFGDIQQLNRALLRSGASIHEMNIVRRHLNVALGGGLARAASPAKVITLAISDVVGDDPATIASGATVADPTTLDDAREILLRYDIDAPDVIYAALNNPDNETLKPGDAVFEGSDYKLVATPGMALNAAEKFWQGQGFETHIFDDAVEGDTNAAAKNHVDFIKRVCERGENLSRPCAIISGGETTVKVSGSGNGGPNTQFMLQAAILLDGYEGVYGMACDTDGIDGSADNAGAFITPQTLSLGAKAGMSASEFLSDNNSYAFFEGADQLVKTGPTYTNVNDYRVFLLLP